jgi:sialic acid synthase
LSREITIDNTPVGDATDSYVIAEIGHNHQGDLEKCKALFLAAKECGANAAKLQKRDNRALFTADMYDAPYENRNSYGDTYGEHRERLEFGRDEYLALKDYAAEIGITFFATAFDVPSADFLAELDMPAYKIASGDLLNTPLLEHVAGIGKPIVMSTGGGNIADVQRAYDLIMPINSELCILQCTSGYPSVFEELNLHVIESYRERFADAVIGYSGHENGIAIAVVAHVLGARVIEKHFTLDRTWKGTDQAMSLTPAGLKRMVRDLKRARVAMGDPDKRALDSEQSPLKKQAKYIVAGRDLEAGHVLGAADLAYKISRNAGLPPYAVAEVVGRKINKALGADQNITMDDLEPA